MNKKYLFDSIKIVLNHSIDNSLVSKKNKILFKKTINESDEYELLSILLNEKVNNNLTLEEKINLKENFKKELTLIESEIEYLLDYKNILREEDEKPETITSKYKKLAGKNQRLLAVVSVAAIIAGVDFIYQQALKRGLSPCLRLTTNAREKCRLKVKTNSLKQKAENLRSSVSKCSAASNPEHCKDVLENEYHKILDQLEELESKLLLKNIGKSNLARLN